MEWWYQSYWANDWSWRPRDIANIGSDHSTFNNIACALFIRSSSAPFTSIFYAINVSYNSVLRELRYATYVHEFTRCLVWDLMVENLLLVSSQRIGFAFATCKHVVFKTTIVWPVFVESVMRNDETLIVLSKWPVAKTVWYCQHFVWPHHLEYCILICLLFYFWIVYNLHCWHIYP